MAEHLEKLGSMGVKKLLLQLSLPTMLGMFANAIYNIIDTVFIGRGVGSIGIAALTIVLPMMAIVSSFAHLIGVGTSSFISRMLGKGQLVEVNKVAGNGFLLIAIIGAFFSLLGLLFTDEILKVFGATQNILPFANDYAKIIFIGVFWFPFCIATSNYLRAEGNARDAMYAMLAGLIVNTILDYLLIFELEMGMRGAALATIAGYFTNLLFLIRYFVFSKSVIKIKLKYLKIQKTMLRPIISVGLSGFGMRSSSSLANVVLNHTLGSLGGDIAIAVFGVIYKITLFFAMPFFGINQGMQPIVGYNFGAGNMNRIKKTIKIGFSFSLLYGLSLIVIIQIFAYELFTLFTPEKEILQYGPRALRIVTSMVWLMGINQATTGIHQALGKSMRAFFLAILRWVILIIPLIVVLPYFMLPNIDGVWFAFPLADILAASISFLVLYRTLRTNKIIDS